MVIIPFPLVFLRTSQTPDAPPALPTVRRASPHHSLLLLFTVVWGSNFVLAEMALREMTAIAFSVARFGMAALVMLVILYFRERSRASKNGGHFTFFPQLKRSQIPRLVAVAILGATLAPWLGIEGLKLTSSGRASLWLAMLPVVSAALGVLLQTERIRWLGTLGLVAAGVGTIGLALDGVSSEQQYWLGDVFLVVAICCTAIELHLIKPLAAEYGSTSMVATRNMIGVPIYLLIASPALVQQPWLNLDVWTWVAILVGGGIGVGMGQWVKVRALNVLGPTRVVLYGNLVPPVTLLLAWLILGTEPTALEVGAGLLIVAGAVCVQMGGSTHQQELEITA